MLLEPYVNGIEKSASRPTLAPGTKGGPGEAERRPGTKGGLGEGVRPQGLRVDPVRGSAPGRLNSLPVFCQTIKR